MVLIAAVEEWPATVEANAMRAETRDVITIEGVGGGPKTLVLKGNQRKSKNRNADSQRIDNYIGINNRCR